MNDSSESVQLLRGSHKITLSLQGQIFVLPANNVICHDWLVKTIVETEVGIETLSDVIYLDCEPDSFLLIYKLLNNLYDIKNLSKLSEISLELLLSCCNYMNCCNLAIAIEERIGTMRSKTDADLKEKNALLEKIDELQTKLDESDMSFLFEHSTPIYKCSCNIYRTRRPGNKCGNPALIIGDVTTDKIECPHCEEPMKVKRMSVRDSTQMGIIGEMQDVASHNQKYN